MCAIALTATADAPSHIDSTGIDIATVEYERQVRAEAAAQRQLEARQAAAREAAHARMPSTMYASTPSDPNEAPHVMPGSASKLDDIIDLVMPRYLESVSEAESKPFSQRWSRVLRTIQRVEQSRSNRNFSSARTHPAHALSVPFSLPSGGRTALVERLVIPYFPSASDPSDRQGLVRVINRSSREGEVTIEAIDDTGIIVEPITFPIGASSAFQLNSADLEHGNLAKGLRVGTGPGQGAWVLALTSTVTIEAHAYIQTPDGYLTPISGTDPNVDADSIVTYLSSTNEVHQRDLLRLVNLNTAPATVVIARVDELDGRRNTVTVELPARQARTYHVHELATGIAPGISGFLDEFEGTWQRLALETVPGVMAMRFVTSDAGHLTNIPRLPVETGSWDISLFMSASDPLGRQGVLHVVNRESRRGNLAIRAFDDVGRSYEALTLSLEANEVVEIDSNDLEFGNSAKGLPSGTGSGQGDWRLELSSELELSVLPFVRTPDGLVTPMHDTVSSTENRYDVAWFKAVDDSKQVGSLRLINAGEQPVIVSIHGSDDQGIRRGTAQLTLASHASRMLTAMELESGSEDMNGSLGNGFGEWRLEIAADASINVMNLVSLPTGHLTNLSSSAIQALNEDETAESVFESDISPIVQSQCINCHVRGGRSQNTRLVFVGDEDADHLTKNMGAFQALLDEVENGADYVLNKIQGVGHGGGVQVRAGTDNFAAMERFLELLGQEPEEGPSVTPETLFESVALESDRQTLRRAAIVFAGRVPTDEEYAMLVDDDETSLRTAIRGLMQGPGFHEFLVRASNDRLFTDRDFRIVDDDGDGFVDYAKALYDAGQDGRAAYNEFKRQAQYGFRREPLELVAHIAENDLPWTDLLTADYVMANPMTATAYGASTEFTNEEDPHEFQPSEIVNYYRRCDGYQVERADLGYIVVNAGPCSTEYPHAGLLNSKVFLQRYPTTATNRNRARSRWTYYHFLGLDIERSASRTTDPVALADTNNPTLGNPACTVCHSVLDPVAGVFQNYGDAGSYRDQRGGMDALDRFYKYNPSGRNDVSIEERSNEDSVISLGTVRLFADRDNELGLKNLRTFEGETKLHFGLGEVTVQDLSGNVVHQYEVSDVVAAEDCGSAFEDGYRLWDCQKLLPLPLAVTETADYEVQVEAWVIEDGATAGTLQVWMPGPFYREGDTWYRDMREPGFGEDQSAEAHNSVQWLAAQIVEDERFSLATVKFWWPAIMGSEVIEPPEDADDTGYEARLLASTAQTQEVERLAIAFSAGFHEGDPFNLKDLLVEITLSSWFRAVSVESEDELQSSALLSAGARRLLTPAELANKTLDLTGFQWGRHRDQSWSQPHEDRLSLLTDPQRGYGLLYGGIDSDGITERARDLTSTMAGVAQSHAAESSCPIVMRELFLLPEADRLLFDGFDRAITPKWEFGETFVINAASWTDRETLAQAGHLSAGLHEVAMTFTNNFDDDDGDRNVRLYEIRVLNANDEVVHEASLKDLAPTVASSGECGIANAWNEDTEERDHFNLHSTCMPVVAEFTIESEGTHSIQVVVWADQHGGDLAELEIVVQSDTVSSAGATSIRKQLSRLYSYLHGIDVGTDSAEVQGAYELFVEVWESNLDSEQAATDFRHWQDIECDWSRDHYFLDGILADAWVFREDWDDGRGPRHDWDWEQIGSFFETVDFSDRQGSARTWVVVMAYLLMDYRYLYL